MKDITNFGWDKLEVFDHILDRADIERVLRVPFPDYEEVEKRIAFHECAIDRLRESDPLDVERPLNGDWVRHCSEGTLSNVWFWRCIRCRDQAGWRPL
jgi:hypothetical protein